MPSFFLKKTVIITFLTIANLQQIHAAKPVLELSLGETQNSPTANAVAAAENSYNGQFSSAFAQLEAAYSQTLSKATPMLGATIAKALGSTHSSFLKTQSQGNIIEPTVAVRVIDSKSDNVSGANAVQSLLSKDAQAESALIASAKSEFEDLAKVVIGEFDKQIRMHRGSFLGTDDGNDNTNTENEAGTTTADINMSIDNINTKQSFLKFNREVNIRLVNDPNYGSIGNMLSGFQSRRDSSIDALRAKILTLEMNLVQTLNRVGATALGY